MPERALRERRPFLHDTVRA